MTDTGSKKYWAAFFTFLMWGTFPVYWKLFAGLPSFDVFLARLFFSFATLIIILGFKQELMNVVNIVKDRNVFFRLTISGVLISFNWVLYIYAVATGQIIEASLGYFLNPLINVLLGRIFLGETLRNTQIPSLLIAGLAIVILGADAGINSFPWIALSLSLSFAAYGLIRKTTPVSSLNGLSFETFIIGIGLLIYCAISQHNPMAAMSELSNGLLFVLSLSGVITCVPLILFSYCAKRMPLKTLGLFQYFSPTLKFICGWYFFHEPMSDLRWGAFALIWVSLIYYTAESFWFSKKPLGKINA